MNDFKVGDIVRCVDAKAISLNSDGFLLDGELYRVVERSIGSGHVEVRCLSNGEQSSHGFYAHRFVLVSAHELAILKLQELAAAS